MADFVIKFNQPWLLLVLLPLLLITLIPFFLIPAKFRNTRNRVISVTLHCLVAVFITCVLAGMYFMFTVPNSDNEIMIVVDASDSNEESKDDKDAYIQSILGMCDDKYKVGIVTFGYDTVYASPLSFDTDEVFENYLSAKKPDTSATNIAGALEFAADQFENPMNSKIVLLSDGFETDRNASDMARLVASTGVKIDTVSFPDEEHGEIQLTAAEMPKQRITLNKETLLQLTIESSVEESSNVTVTIFDNNEEKSTSSLTIEPGETVVEIPHTFSVPGEHDIMFMLECSSSSDHITENNIYQAHLNITVPSSVLILENIPGEASGILQLLPTTYTRRDVINVHTQATMLPNSAKELCEYDQVVLCNMANSDLTSESMPADFVQALYSYVYDMGGSLFTYGGANDSAPDGTIVPHAYNRSDLANTLFQEMLPVEAVDYTPPSAVMIVVDSSGSMSGKYEAALKGAEQVLDALYESNPYSYCGVTTFAVDSQEQMRILPVSQRETIRKAIDDLLHFGDGGSDASGGTVFSQAIFYAGLALSAIDVPIKHMILMTDGNPDDPLEAEGGSDYYYGQYIEDNRENGITLSVITFDADPDDAEDMRRAAEEYGGGKYYGLSTSQADLDSIGMTMRQDLAAVRVEAIRDNISFSPEISKLDSPIYEGLTSPGEGLALLPELKGYYGTRARGEADVYLTYQYVPIYAEWQFGAGKVGSFMSDIGGAWSTEFINTLNGGKLITNILNNLAPLSAPEPDVLDFVLKGTEKNYTNRLDVYTDLAEGETVRVTVKYSSLNSLANVNADYAMAMQHYGLNGIQIQPIAGGSSFEFDIIYTGIYEILIEKVDAAGNIVADVSSFKTFSYSSEYDGIRDGDEAAALLADIAAGGGGVVQTDPVDTITSFDPTLDVLYDPAMLLLILSAVLFLADVAVRKFKFKWPHEIIRDRKAMRDQQQSGHAAHEGGQTD